jgi:hypothetical protein
MVPASMLAEYVLDSSEPCALAKLTIECWAIGFQYSVKNLKRTE